MVDKITICQYIAEDEATRAQVVALAECMGLEYRVSREVVAVMCKDDVTLDLLRRAVPGPSSVVQGLAD